MKILFLFLFLPTELFWTGCVPATRTSKKSPQKNIIIADKSLALHPDMFMDKYEQGIDFIASGNEPFWSLDINFDSFMHFKLADGAEINTVSVKELNSIDEDIICYQANNKLNTLTVKIQNKDCFNDMSGAKLPYTVTIITKNNAENNDQNYKGCGRYLVDYRLHDIWVLDSINNKKMITKNFIHGIPRIEFNLTEKKVFVTNNCQTLNGNIEVKGKKIYFDKFSASDIACKPENMEAAHLQKLATKIISYQIKPGNLYLQVSADSVFIYKKID